jgi:hypothetical protein
MAHPPKDAVLSLPATVTVTATGLRLSETLSDEDWLNVGHRIVRVGYSMQWWLGDWWVEGKDRVRSWGGGREAAEKLGVSYATLCNYGAVSRAFEFSCRHENLRFTHHQAAMAAAPDQRHVWLDCAEKNAWSVHQLRSEIAAIETISNQTNQTTQTDQPEAKTENNSDNNDNKPDNSEESDQSPVSISAPVAASPPASPPSPPPTPPIAPPVYDDSKLNDKPSLLQASLLKIWGHASEQDRDIICDLAVARFFEQATGTDILNKLANGRKELFENTLDKIAAYIVNHGYPDLARIFFDAIGPKNMLMMMKALEHKGRTACFVRKRFLKLRKRTRAGHQWSSRRPSESDHLDHNM